jgi:hypothetical protein
MIIIIARRKGTKMQSRPENKAIATIGPDPFAVYAASAAPRTIVGKLLKFNKGDYLAGESAEPISEGTKFIAAMDELLVGWIRWDNSKPAEHRMGRVIDRFVPEPRSALGDNNAAAWETDPAGDARDPWQFCNYLVLKNCATGELFTLVASSRGSINAIGDLCRQYSRASKTHPDDYPVIALQSGVYAHRNKSYGRIKFPVLTVVGRAPKFELDSSATAMRGEEQGDIEDFMP